MVTVTVSAADVKSPVADVKSPAVAGSPAAAGAPSASAAARHARAQLRVQPNDRIGGILHRRIYSVAWRLGR